MDDWINEQITKENYDLTKNLDNPDFKISATLTS